MMMMTGNHPPPSNLRLEDPTGFISHTFSSGNHSPDGAQYERAFLALQRFLPSNAAEDAAAYGDGEDFDVQLDAFSCDDFRMFEFKVRKCPLARSHDWTACPFAHPGEKARRRDPRKYHYSGNACPDFRKGGCRKGDGCEHAHGVFECWLHPARYRTQPCKDGIHCRRRVCFFAHTQEQLRVLPFSSAVPSSETSPGRFGQDPYFSYLYGSSPNSAFYSPPPSPPRSISPPVSPTNLNSVNQLAGSMRGLQINKMKLNLGLTGSSPPTWGLGYGSPPIRPGFLSMPTTPIRGQGQSPRKLAAFDSWTAAAPPCEVEPAVVRVESGRELREKIYAKLVKENSLERAGRGDPNGGFGQDLGWVGDLVN